MIDRSLANLVRSYNRVSEGLIGIGARNAVTEGEGELELAGRVVGDDVGDAEGSRFEVTLHQQG